MVSGDTEACEPKICEIGGKGLFLPALGDKEQEWNKNLRIVLYLLGLGWTFMGVAIVADIFMGAIERITSEKRRVYDPDTGKKRTAQVWNDTVANLTLMALGSSAPEILLSVIELLSNEFYSGELGPSTIVGSAAFNLLCITAVCVVAIPDGQIRKVKDTTVFAITATFSVFAYVWLFFIVVVNTKDVIDIWEGAITFLLFPVLVILSYWADRGYFSSATLRDDTVKSRLTIENMTKEDLASLEVDARKRYPHATESQIARLIEKENAPKMSRAALRVNATRNMVGGKKLNGDHSTLLPSAAGKLSSVVPVPEPVVSKIDIKSVEEVCFEFPSPNYAVLENEGVLNLVVCRYGGTTFEASVEYETRDGTAMGGDDYETTKGTLIFGPGEAQKIICVKIVDDPTYEPDEDFYVDLSNPRCETKQCKATIGPNSTTKVTIIDDDDPGVLSFAEESMHVKEGMTPVTLQVPVNRRQGSTGKVSCTYMTEDATATAGRDYEKLSGTLTFESGVLCNFIEVTILPTGHYEGTEEFRLIITDPTDGARLDDTTDGGETQCICTIVIDPNDDTKDRVDRVFKLMQMDWDKATIGNMNWKEQFVAAALVNGGEEGEVGVLDVVMHIITVVWKLLFALIPPVDFCGGWLCFFSALAMIGLVTAVIGDLAALLGCVIGIPDSITAITLVALGTSLPDTFASKTAAEQDETADASIGNVTGSNSVNVFLGLGLPWLIGAVRWHFYGQDEEWRETYRDLSHVMEDDTGKFVVVGGDLGFSVSVFSSTAVVCLLTLTWRRMVFGGELGGPASAQKVSAVFFVCLWAGYIGLSCWKSLGSASDC